LLNKKVLRELQKFETDGAFATQSGSSFHNTGAATEIALEADKQQ